MRIQDAVSRLKELYRTPTAGPNTSITPEVPLPKIIALSKYIGSDHELALQLWTQDFPGTKQLAILIDVPKKVTSDQMDHWISQTHSRDVCDLLCTTLFDKTDFSKQKILDWVKSEQEFVRRAAFVLIASTAASKNKVPDSIYLNYLLLIEKYSTDERNFVKKAVSWALKRIGKRSTTLYSPALKLAEKLSLSTNDTAKWIGIDALRELRS
ncbi:DNA alkylation repair protein [Candidatus Micrarchaeota archaeon]|nr:DNA alkylation repair protein [Candidatus Micrarchaeota archaeon]